MNKIHVIQFTTRDSENHRIVIETVRRADGTLGARTIESLLMTQDLREPRVQAWNNYMDLLESMLIVQVCNGADITSVGSVEGIKCYVTSVRNRLF